MALKAAMHNWMRPEALETTVARLARCGYSAIEISGEPALYDPAEVRPLLERHGIACWGAVTLMTAGRDLVHEDRYVRRATVDYVKDCLTLVAQLGGSILSVVPSTVGKTIPTAPAEDEWRWCVEGLRACQEHAERVGVRIGIEPLNRFETYFINRCDQALALADEVGGDCGVALDAFHMNIEEPDWPAAIRSAGSRLVDVHVADNNRMPPGQGAIDWEAFVRELAGVGYDGCLSVEFVVSADRTPVSERTEIGDVSEVDAGAGIRQFLLDHSSGALPEHYYDRYAQESIDTLRAVVATIEEGTKV